MMERLGCIVLLMLVSLNVQAQGYFYGTLYFDNEVPEVVVQDRRDKVDLIRVKQSNVKVFDQNNQRIPMSKLHDRDPVSYTYDSYAQSLDVWVDLKKLDRVEE